MTVSSIGQIIVPANVEQAYLSLLQTWLPIYLDEVESQNSLQQGSLPRPPDLTSYYGGSPVESGMAMSWREDMLPVVVVITEPEGDAIHLNSSYQQWFQVQVSAVVLGDDEDSARLLGGYYGGALMASVAQDNTNLNGLAVETMLTAYPRVSYGDPDQREFALVTATFRTLVAGVVNETGRPASPAWPPADIPTADATNLTLTFVPDSQPLP